MVLSSAMEAFRANSFRLVTVYWISGKDQICFSVPRSSQLPDFIIFPGFFIDLINMSEDVENITLLRLVVVIKHLVPAL